MSKNTSNRLLKPYQKTLETGRRMRLWILSDLHLEQSSWQPSFGVEADAVVLAGLNDHRCIKLRDGTFRPKDALARHIAGKAWLEGMFAKPHDGPTVVVTHHCVSRRSVHDRWRNDVISAAFSSNLDALVGSSNADLWVHGHTHDSFDYRIGRTRVVCNPRGYGSENQFFDPKLIVEIGGAS